MHGLALITIGQAPRTDVTPDLAPLLVGVDVQEYGALDTLTEREIADLAPVGAESILVSRLRDGRQVVMSERRVLPHVQRALDRAADDGAAALLVMCTGDLPGLRVRSRAVLYMAEDLARGGSHILAGSRRLGVLVPTREQESDVAARWRRDFGRDVHTAAADPYTAPAGSFASAAGGLTADGAEWIFLDCVGYSEAMADEVRTVLGCPVITARTMAARLVAAIA